MSFVNNTQNVLKQFGDDSNLAFRIAFYEKYDTASITFSDWLFRKYCFLPRNIIIEFGCGNGRHWDNRLVELPVECRLILTDLSDGMVAEVKRKFRNNHNVRVEKVDIQDVPYDDNFADVVIANHMLFHVPDLHKALSEVRRVLKEGGLFYAATDSEEGMRPYMHNVISMFDNESLAFAEKYSFSVENGASILRSLFTSVECHVYEYPLRITDVNELMRWLMSTAGISGYVNEHKEELHSYFTHVLNVNGSIIIPKKAGLFVCVK